jgi:hypothetical protein
MPSTPQRDPTSVRLIIVPVSFREACSFIAEHHRHHPPPRGMKFAVGVHDGTRLVGVVTVGRPVARHLDDGWTAEVTRSCTDGTSNVNSKLYGAAWRTARGMGYRRLVTFTQLGESGVSLRAAGLEPVAWLRPRSGWDSQERPRSSGSADYIARTRWEIRSEGVVVPLLRPPEPRESSVDGAQSPCAPAVSAGTAGEPATSSSSFPLDPAPCDDGTVLMKTAVVDADWDPESMQEGRTVSGIRRPIELTGAGGGDLAQVPWGDLAAAIHELAGAVQAWAAQTPQNSDALLTAEQVAELFSLSPRTRRTRRPPESFRIAGSASTTGSAVTMSPQLSSSPHTRPTDRVAVSGLRERELVFAPAPAGACLCSRGEDVGLRREEKRRFNWVARPIQTSGWDVGE